MKIQPAVYRLWRNSLTDVPAGYQAPGSGRGSIALAISSARAERAVNPRNGIVYAAARLPRPLVHMEPYGTPQGNDKNIADGERHMLFQDFMRRLKTSRKYASLLQVHTAQPSSPSSVVLALAPMWRTHLASRSATRRDK